MTSFIDKNLAFISALLKEKAAARDRCDFERESELKLKIERLKQEALDGADSHDQA